MLTFSENQQEKADDFSKSFMYAIHQMYFLVQKHLEHTLAKSKSISFSQFLVLMMCSKCHTEDQGKASVSQGEIAQCLFITEATVSKHIASLVELGLITRKEALNNRRKHVITLTQKGKTTLKSTQSRIDKELEAMFSSVKEKERTIIMKNCNAVLTGLLSKK